jgi:RNA polymerase sigma factor (sigma-70 family)
MDPSASSSGHSDWFTTTHWSVVLAATGSNSPEAQQALEQLCQTYWYPLYVFVRRQGNSPEDAQDLTQAFFERILERNYFGQADRSKGRLRAFLLASLKHFLSDQRDRRDAAKRGGGRRMLSLDAHTAEERYQLEPADTMTPEKLYERRWAFTLLEKARTNLRSEYDAAGKTELYQLLKVLEPGSGDGTTYADIGQRLGKSESAIKSEASRLRLRYGELVRSEIAQTVASVTEIDDEVRHLLTVIGG